MLIIVQSLIGQAVSAGHDTVVVVLASPITSRIEWSAIIAALAIVVGAIMQLITLRYTQRNAQDSISAARDQTRDTLSMSRAGTRANIASEHLRQLIEDLTRDLSEYLSNSYFIDTGYRVFKSSTDTAKNWPGEHWEYVKKEDLLYNKIRLRLNPANEHDEVLIAQLEALRDLDSAEEWIRRRDRVIQAAQSSFGARWQSIMQKELGI